MSSSEDAGRYDFNVSCDTIRRKINMFLATKEMTQTAFLEAIGHVNSNSLGRFMKLKGPYSGSDNGTFWGAVKFFQDRDRAAKEAKKSGKQKKGTGKTATGHVSGGNETSLVSSATGKEPKKRRHSATDVDIEPESDDEEYGNEKENQPPAAKKLKTSGSSSAAASSLTPSKAKNAEIDKMLTDVMEVQLADERVFDHCDEVRTKIGGFLHSEGVSMARFAKALDITPLPINRFMSRKGFNQGAGSDVYRKAYYFFEKLRIFRNLPKTPARVRSEQEHPHGYKLENPAQGFRYRVGTPVAILNAIIRAHNDPHRDQFQDD